MNNIEQYDPEISQALKAEIRRQKHGLELIPSENFVSPAVMEALGSVLTNKYSEGYPGKRYYGGNVHVDEIENIARERAKKLFGVDHANVQPYSGSPANQAVCFALLDPGDTLMGLSLAFGGHMTHGLKVNFSAKYYRSVQYQTNQNGWLDYDMILDLAKKERPKLIIVGATAYPRKFDFEKFRDIARQVDAFLLADISHIAGLIIAGEHPSPVGLADVISTTTHKTLRGPRGAMILSNGNPSTPLKAVDRSRENIPTLIDRAIIPGLQGGPHNHQTAAIAIALHEAAQPEFREYGKQVTRNAKALADSLLEQGAKLITDGTDNHLMVIDVTPFDVTGKEAEIVLDSVGITVNKNMIPFDERKPFDPSGIRLGTPAITTRGMDAAAMKKIGVAIASVLKQPKNTETLDQARVMVRELTEQFPLYPELKP
ncbi:MAG: serine hydroxymethyltransferase [bacterium]|nr:serine hydroxymethyltransferase [bacterium]